MQRGCSNFRIPSSGASVYICLTVSSHGADSIYSCEHLPVPVLCIDKLLPHSLKVNMPSIYVFVVSAFFAVNAVAAMDPLPRGAASLFQLTNPLLERDPQSGSVCNGLNCGSFCIPPGYHCCSDGGAGCPAGSVCVPNGCCPAGAHCAGGGGTITDPGGVAAPPTLSVSKPKFTPQTTFANTAIPSSIIINPGTISSVDGFQSYLATAYPSTGSAGGAVVGVASSSTSDFPQVAITASSALAGDSASSTSFPSALSQAPISQASSSSNGAVSGGSSSSSSSSQKASGTKAASRSTVLSGMVVLVGLFAVQML